MDSNSEKNFTEIKWSGNKILLFGSEGYGIKVHTKKYTDFLVKIKIDKRVESMNALRLTLVLYSRLTIVNQFFMIQPFLLLLRIPHP